MVLNGAASLRLKGEWTTLEDLPPGTLFETEHGTRAVKSEYTYGEGRRSDQWQCILLGSGEYAHFKDGNATRVREVFVCEHGLTGVEQLARYGRLVD